MKTRREFLKEAATGAVMVGSSAAAESLGLSGMLEPHARKAKVVIARDPALHGQSPRPMRSAFLTCSTAAWQLLPAMTLPRNAGSTLSRKAERRVR
jgi:hypothetical protein